MNCLTVEVEQASSPYWEASQGIIAKLITDQLLCR